MKSWNAVPFALAGFLSITSPGLAAPAVYVAAHTDAGTYFSGCAYIYQNTTGGFNDCSGGAPYGASAGGTSAVGQTSAVANSFLNTGDQTISASGTVDLARGTLGAYVNQAPASYGRGDAYAQFSDVLDFTVAGASASTVTSVQFSVQVAGSLNVSPFQNDSATFSFEALNQGVFYPSGFNAVFSPLGNSATGVQTNFLTENPNYIDALVTVNLLGPTDDITIQSEIGCSVDILSSCDFGGGGKGGALAIIPKAGVSFTSDALFLTQPPAGAVPELATWAMMSGGLGLIGAFMRRRPKVTAKAWC